MLYEEGDEALSEEAISLAMGPLKKAERYTGYVINGFKYHTKARESNRATQHSGVMVKANTDSFASARDMNPIAGDVNYYGVLTDIIVLHYSKKFRFVLFKCDWVYNGIGLVDRDGLGFTLINFNHLAHSQNISDEPYIFASQAEQVFFVQEKQFVSSRSKRKNSTSLLNVVQEKKKSLACYLGRFNAATLEIDNLDKSVKYTAFLRGLLPTSKFAFSVNKSPPGNMKALLEKANKYIQAEEYLETHRGRHGEEKEEQNDARSNEKKSLNTNAKSKARGHRQKNLPLEDGKLQCLLPLKAWQSPRMETPPQA
ncbi:hypothetical protein RJ639_009519 [Escallonia herrerae]|uniref:DUF4216 domain-containing protein n=1 Tax=Escallonia herrerae TaxID=1293975 RepID=A0AA89ASM5_9ASTE|nr:hypothetical protein RJ639_009519 [Escallonia herrerae]